MVSGQVSDTAGVFGSGTAVPVQLGMPVDGRIGQCVAAQYRNRRLVSRRVLAGAFGSGAAVAVQLGTFAGCDANQSRD